MTIKELSIFIQDKKGKLTEISKLMSENSLNIRGFFISDSTDGYGIFRLIMNNHEVALKNLKEKFTVYETEVIAVKISEEPGGLYKLLNLLSKNNINVEYIYSVINSVIVLKLDDDVKAQRVLEGNNIEILANNKDI